MPNIICTIIGIIIPYMVFGIAKNTPLLGKYKEPGMTILQCLIYFIPMAIIFFTPELHARNLYIPYFAYYTATLLIFRNRYALFFFIISIWPVVLSFY